MKKENVAEMLSGIKTDMINRYSDDKYYKFQAGGVSFPDMIDSTFIHLNQTLYSLWESTEPTLRQQEVLKSIYQKIFGFCNNLNYDTKFGKYKMYVIAGYLIWRLGFVLSNKLSISYLKGKQPTNQNIYEAVKYHINKFAVRK